VIYFRNATRGSRVDTRALKKTARALLEAVGEGDAAISLSLVNDREIRELNRKHRGKDAATDVLSFPLYETDAAGSVPRDDSAGERLLGDVVISVETARRQADAYDAPIQTEVNRLLIHGILHVLGHDHMERDERAAMETEERRLATVIGMPWPYDD
jgi:probable rRNA maturation factor